MAWLSAIDEDVRSVKKLVGALIHSVQAVSEPILYCSVSLTLHVLQGKACYHVVGDRCDDQATETTQ